jgi:hypothetical protein
MVRAISVAFWRPFCAAVDTSLKMISRRPARQEVLYGVGPATRRESSNIDLRSATVAYNPSPQNKPEPWRAFEGELRSFEASAAQGVLQAELVEGDSPAALKAVTI